jgi:hypothetical protein
MKGRDIHLEFVGYGHHVYIENFYSSPVLFEALKESNTGACSTIRANRSGLPVEIRLNSR